MKTKSLSFVCATIAMNLNWILSESLFAADSNAAVLEQNKTIVREFYEMSFIDHKPKEAAEKYLAPNYVQHNPFVATGRQPFIDFFVPYFKKHKESRSEIKRLIADGDLVVVHVHSKSKNTDRGNAVIDIFRIENGKITEHWDVAQPISEKSANQNTMF